MIPTIGRWPQAPDLIEPIEGFRAWRYIADDQGVLILSFMIAIDGPPLTSDWEGAWARWVTASCLFDHEPGHVAPEESCSCGFYATKSANDLALMAILLQHSHSGQDDGSDGAVVGRVHLAGKVIEHESGYRAERARIAELIPTTTDAGITLSLAARLDLPVGPVLDTAPILRQMEEQLPPPPSMTERPRDLGPLDRWRLRTHRRRFHLIQGGQAG